MLGIFFTNLSMALEEIEIFSSSSSEQRWVKSVCRILDVESIVDIETPACVFHVPEAIKSVKPEVYAPQKIGLGPYHHFQPKLYQMEMNKLAAVRRLAKQHQQIRNFHQPVVDKLKEIEPTIRACYDKYLDHDEDTLALTLAIDGLYLFELLLSYRNKGSDAAVDPAGRRLARDVMMLENQIPFILLKEIFTVISVRDTSYQEITTQLEMIQKATSVSQAIDERNIGYDEIILGLFHGFSKVHSPLEIIEQYSSVPQKYHMHLLSCMYYWIVSNGGTPEPAPMDIVTLMSQVDQAFQSSDTSMNIGQISNVLNRLGIGYQIMSTIDSMKRLEVFWKKDDSLDKSKASFPNEVTFPSASKLFKDAGVKFKLINGGIRDIKFDDENATLCLPAMTQNIDSEIILQNLAAHEAIMVESGMIVSYELTAYVNLMCALVDSAEDVSLLRKQGIVRGSLADNQIASHFNKVIDKSTFKLDGNSDAEKAMDKVFVRYYLTPRVKVYRIFMKHVYASWKFLTFLSAVLLLLLMILQAFCQVYGCSAHFFPDVKIPDFPRISSLVQE